MLFPTDDALGTTVERIAAGVLESAASTEHSPRRLARQTDDAWQRHAFFHLSIRWAVVPGLPNTIERHALRHSMAAAGLVEGWPKAMFAAPADEVAPGPPPYEFEL